MTTMTRAQDFTATHGDADYDRVCDNLEAIGYEYWFTQDCITHFRHPVTRHVAEVVCH